MFSLLVVERSSPVHRFITSAGICPSRLSVFLKGAPINVFLKCMYRSGLYFKINCFVRKLAATHSICETHMKVFKITDAFGEKNTGIYCSSSACLCVWISGTWQSIALCTFLEIISGVQCKISAPFLNSWT